MKILIIRLSSLGDIILTQPVISLLFEEYPSAEIHYICKPQFVELVQCLDPRIKAIAYEKNPAMLLRLANSKYDIVLDLHGKLASWLISRSVKAKTKKVYDKRRSMRKAIVSGAKDLFIESTTSLYFSALDGIVSKEKQKLATAPRIGLPDRTPHLELLPDFDPKFKTIAIFPGAAHPTKIYPYRYLNESIKLTGKEYRFILLGSYEENHLGLRLADANPEKTFNLCGAYSFAQLIHVLERCDLVISGDSGPMHLAAALGKKQIAIFGSTHPRLGFAPQNPHAKVICLNLSCQPCSLHGANRCPLGHFDCMMKIKPADLMREIQTILG